MTTPDRRLWQYPEPDLFGADDEEEFETWAELRDNVRRYLGALNVPYRWEWRQVDTRDTKERFYLSVLLAGKERVVEWWCPIQREDEPEVRELLADIAAYLRTAGTPMLFDDGREPPR